MANIEGRNPIIEALRSDRPIDKLMISNTSKEGSIKKIIGMAKEKNVVIQYVDKHKLDEISTSHSHQGVIAVVSDYKYYELEDLLAIARERGEDPFFIILDEITDPHNLGTIIRTADAVGAHGVIIPKRRSVHITSVVAKASAGAVEYVPVCKVTNIANTIKQLKKEGLWIAAADMDGGVFYERSAVDSDIGEVEHYLRTVQPEAEVVAVYRSLRSVSKVRTAAQLRLSDFNFLIRI